jgi:endonuclease/exonuclease/phosphatase family metal-dependent hydrolase
MSDGHVRAMTWNIWWRFGPHWQERQAAILATIDGVRPDVVALQEVWGSEDTTQAHELGKALGMHAGFAQPSYPAVPTDSDEPGISLGVAVLSRWPLHEQAVVALPARHRAWDPVALTARVEHPRGPMPVVATCLEHATVYSDDRIAQARQLADLGTSPDFDGPCPILVMGDLNASPDSAVLRPMRDVLTDAWTAGGGAADAVTLPSSHPSAPLEAGPELVDQRIDHIFFRPGREGQHVIVEATRIVGSAVDGVFPSDHRAVVADLRWRG